MITMMLTKRVWPPKRFLCRCDRHRVLLHQVDWLLSTFTTPHMRLKSHFYISISARHTLKAIFCFHIGPTLSVHRDRAFVCLSKKTDHAHPSSCGAASWQGRNSVKQAMSRFLAVSSNDILSFGWGLCTWTSMFEKRRIPGRCRDDDCWNCFGSSLVRCLHLPLPRPPNLREKNLNCQILGRKTSIVKS